MTFADTDRRKILPHGPRPKNTLSRPPFPTGPVSNRKAAPIPNPRGGTQQALSVEIHKGSNVKSLSNVRPRDEILPTPPSAKRRKLDRLASPASSSQTDPLDQLSPNAMTFHASQGASQLRDRAPSASASNQISGFPMKRNGSFEYRNVEMMMDSNPKRRKQRHSDNRKHQADLELLPSSPKRSSMSHPIDISGDESQITNSNSKEVPRPTYRGTARQPPPAVNMAESTASDSRKERAKLTQSPFFNKSGLPAPRSNGNVKHKLAAQSSAREKSPRLAHKFVAADGRRRGSDANASSDADELQSAPTTVGLNADPDAIFIAKEMRSNSPSKHSSSTLKATSPTDDLAVWAPSIVKSDFASSNARSQNGGHPHRTISADQEAKPPWSVALAAISLPGNLHKNEDLGLVYDGKQKEYHIRESGEEIRATHSSLRIQPTKLNKILWEKSGLRVRLESSRSGTEDNFLDLELVSERDLSDLLRRLQISRAVSVVGKNRCVIQVLERALMHRI